MTPEPKQTSSQPDHTGTAVQQQAGGAARAPATPARPLTGAAATAALARQCAIACKGDA